MYTKLDGMYTKLDDGRTTLDGVYMKLDGVYTKLDDGRTTLDGVYTKLDGMYTKLHHDYPFWLFCRSGYDCRKLLFYERFNFTTRRLPEGCDRTMSD